MTKRKKIDDGSNGWEDMLLKTKIEEYDRLVSAVAVAKETKEQKIEDIVSSSLMPGGTYYRWKRGTAEAIRAAIADVPGLGDRHHISLNGLFYFLSFSLSSSLFRVLHVTSIIIIFRVNCLHRHSCLDAH